MDKIGEYIRRIEIDSLWSGQKHIVWELNRKVNILSGVNGVGSPVLHGKNGEDGTIQGLFQLAEIPFVGCDCISSMRSCL